jgi:hypothetical protein
MTLYNQGEFDLNEVEKIKEWAKKNNAKLEIQNSDYFYDSLIPHMSLENWKKFNEEKKKNDSN